MVINKVLMSNKLVSFKSLLSILIVIFAFFINYYYANKGLYPIDSFSFFDTAYYITEGQHPVKDFWVISGILIDYIQALFFKIFGVNWNAYIFHASLFNVIASLFFFYFLNQFNKNLIYNFILSLSVATLCYPVVGTPFPYQHSLILSIISLLVFYLAVYKEEKKYWIILPLIMFFSFMSMQLPSGLINLLIIIFIVIYFISFNKKFLKYFLAGSILPLLIFCLYFVIIKVPLEEFFTQIILFPLALGQSRIVSEEDAFEGAKLINKLTIRGTIGHFKFINLFLFANIILLLLHIKKDFKKIKFDKKIFINIFILFCALSFIFHQLITANQTFIFSLIPILCGLFIIQLDEFLDFKKKDKLKFFLIILVLFVTVKYHFVYNEKRKFVDLQHINFSSAVDARVLSTKFNNLRWITPYHFSKSPKDELELLSQSMKIIKNDPNNKMLITHYQFFSSFIDQDLNIPNRWYYNNNTFPSSKENRYFNLYIKKFNKKINVKKIETIYVVETHPGEFKYIDFKEFLKKKCFKKEKFNKILYSVKLKVCD